MYRASARALAAFVALASVAVAAAILVAGCGDDKSDRARAPDAARTSRSKAAQVEQPPTRTGQPAEDPLAGIDDEPEPAVRLPSDTAGPVPSATTLRGAVPPHGCVSLTRDATRVWAERGPIAIVATADRFVVAGYAGGAHEKLFVVEVAPDLAPRPLLTIALDRPAAERETRPALAVLDARRVAIAIVDGAGDVRATEIRTGSARPASSGTALVRIAGGADLRFAPAIAASGERLAIAWTDSRRTPMRTWVSTWMGPSTGSSPSAPRDVTPAAMGASAPVFIAGASRPTLLFVDAREGVSPIVRVPFDPAGMPRPHEVAVPVGTVTEPTELAAAQSERGRVHIAYTAIGRAATTAVGLVQPGAAATTPVALVPGTGYGTLHVSAAPAPAATLFAADAPRGGATASSAPRSVHVRVVDDAGIGPPLILDGPDATATHAAIARRADGTAGVAFTSSVAVYVSWIRCDDRRAR